MIWTIVIVVISFLLIKFIYSLIHDRYDLSDLSLTERFSDTVSKLNDVAFNGQGQINKTSRNEFNLHKKGGNQIIYFIYGTGSLTIVWKVATVSNEIIYKERFGNIRNLSLSEQEKIAIAAIEGIRKLLPSRGDSIRTIQVDKSTHKDNLFPSSIRAWDGEKMVTDGQKVLNDRMVLIMNSTIVLNNRIPVQLFELDIIKINGHDYYYITCEEHFVEFNAQENKKFKLKSFYAKEPYDIKFLDESKNWQQYGNIFQRGNTTTYPSISVHVIIPKYFTSYKRVICQNLGLEFSDSFDINTLAENQILKLIKTDKFNMSLCCPICGSIPMNNHLSWPFKKYFNNGVSINVCEKCFVDKEFAVPKSEHESSTLAKSSPINQLNKWNLKGKVRTLNHRQFDVLISELGDITKVLSKAEARLDYIHNTFDECTNANFDLSFDEKGTLLNESVNYFDGSPNYTVDFRYKLDSGGFIISTEANAVYSSPLHKVVRQSKYNYDKYGFISYAEISEENSYTSANNSYCYYCHTRDPNGNLISETYNYGEDDMLIAYVYSFDNKGDQIISEYHDGDLYEIKLSNKLLLETRDEKYKLKEIITYNTYSDITSIKSAFLENDFKYGKSNRDIIYDYDNRGNWIRGIFYTNHTPTTIIEREIDYY